MNLNVTPSMPFVGQTVLFHQGPSEKPVNGTSTHPAIVTRVWNENCVNLVVFFDSRGPIVVTSITKAPNAGGSSWSFIGCPEEAPPRPYFTGEFEAVTDGETTVQPGDVVALKSGGPLMTVTGADKNINGNGFEVDVVYYNGSEFKRDTFDLAELIVIDPAVEDEPEDGEVSQGELNDFGAFVDAVLGPLARARA